MFLYLYGILILILIKIKLVLTLFKLNSVKRYTTNNQFLNYLML